ncbi:ABC1 kinase family protein [Pseudodesulfovibrio sediminis]|uniref:ABC transporter n=1 Tax=Pseudodesulfovibrio sediminis TaxID=2810563 RepID=A0ABM7P438_9BACT|nr:AarF/UbiB family protein [Pseudodesulfovibrio sediminis]BCS87599.1 ABC transporter [Pseudodesulfovibrio sediminis]
MTQHDETPKGRMARGLAYSGMAARMGGTYLKYAASKPFASESGRTQNKKNMHEKNAEVLFTGLSRLKGTALKIAQLLSLELDIFPPEICAQLEKSYTDVPPMNRAMAHKLLVNAYGTRPEEVFRSFDSAAFAAASLGQVHRAEDLEGKALALKVQYPTIRQTIHDDIRLLRGVLRPFADYKAMKPAIKEIEHRFMEETDYLAEASNMQFFSDNLELENVSIPQVYEGLCTDRVLCMSFMEGQPLNHWLATSPPQEDRDTVARRLNRIFLKSLYELTCIHADPNPGNYLIRDDLSIGLVDYGCVKRFTPEFVQLYRRLPQIIISGDKAAYFAALRDMHVVDKELGPEVEEAIFECAYAFGKWLGRLYESEYFDFGVETGFISEGKEIMRAMLKQRSHFTMNPDMIFLDRTRYGLLRIYEQLKCRISLCNHYENSGY